jgi:hypothetical protein
MTDVPFAGNPDTEDLLVPKVLGDVLNELKKLPPTLIIDSYVSSQTKTTIVVDNQGEASVVRHRGPRTLVLWIDLPNE